MSLESKIWKPIFVIGCCNSGTTILWEALKAQREISGPVVEGQDLEGMPELMTHFLGKHTFRMWAHYLHERPWGWKQARGKVESKAGMHPGDRLAYYVTENDWTEEHQRQIEDVYQKHIIPGTRLCDKSPAHTLRARFLQKCFPDTTFIAIVRSPYAVAEGIVRKRRDDHWKRPEFFCLRTQICDGAYQWRGANEVIVSYQKDSLLKRLKIIKYEDLVRNPKRVLTEVFSFCDLPTEKGCCYFPIFEEDRNQRQIAYLKKDDINTITRIVKPLLEQFDYKVIRRGRSN